MSQLIVYNNINGGVSVCVPTGEVSIEVVLQKDCPAGAIIVDTNALPQGSDALFQSAWVLNGSTITVNISYAIIQQNSNLNQMVYNESGHRAVKTLSGISNVLSDANWNALVTNAKNNISASTTTEQLVAAIVPVQEAITANAAI
jgi:hypothetical protein